jgi:RNA polymerase sigma factor (TIGR02999 family)
MANMQNLTGLRYNSLRPLEKNMSPDPKDDTSPVSMHEVTRVLRAVQSGDLQASNELLEIVYDELRTLARSRLKGEPMGGAGMTLGATALVHEAYLRLVSPAAEQGKPQPAWQGRGHFFGAAAISMRRILVERARHRNRIKHGGGRGRVDLDAQAVSAAAEDQDPTDLIALDEALKKLEQMDPRKGQVVSLRYFGGLSVEETAAAMDLSPATIKNEWAFARAWLHREMSGEADAKK